MRRPERFLSLALLAGLAPGNGPPPPDRFDTLVRGFMASHRIPSVAIAVVRNGRVLKAAGYGPASLELPVPAGPHTLYEIGSITKQFTAVAVLQLVEQGKLALDAPIERYLQDLPAQWRSITLLQLLTHTSGLPDWEGPGLLSFRREYTLAEFLAVIGSRPLDFVPGERWAYSNSTFPLLGAIIERVSGESYEAFVTQHVLAPAGMRETRFRHNDAVIQGRAAGYVDSAGKFWSGEPRRPEILLANGGILSNPVDMAKWSGALAHAGLLLPASLERMTRPVRLNDGKSFNAGIGWFLASFHGHRMLLHNGSTAAGFSSVIYRYPDDGLAVVVLLNIDRGALVNDLATQLADLVIPGLAQKH